MRGSSKNILHSKMKAKLKHSSQVLIEDKFRKEEFKESLNLAKKEKETNYYYHLCIKEKEASALILFFKEAKLENLPYDESKQYILDSQNLIESKKKIAKKEEKDLSKEIIKISLQIDGSFLERDYDFKDKMKVPPKNLLLACIDLIENNVSNETNLQRLCKTIERSLFDEITNENSRRKRNFTKEDEKEIVNTLDTTFNTLLKKKGLPERLHSTLPIFLQAANKTKHVPTCAKEILSAIKNDQLPLITKEQSLLELAPIAEKTGNKDLKESIFKILEENTELVFV